VLNKRPLHNFVLDAKICAMYKEVMAKQKNTRNLVKTPVVTTIPAACADELKAVEFFEKQRWGDCPCCVKCGSVNVYAMADRKTGERSKRFLWRCKDCSEQYTVRIGTVYEESRLPLRHWVYAFWRASTSKKGVSALEIQRQCQISYKSALFLMNRIRFAMAPDLPTAEPLKGILRTAELRPSEPRQSHPLQRTISAIKTAEGKRLMYSDATAAHA
jgi:hypothetical protein